MHDLDQAGDVSSVPDHHEEKGTIVKSDEIGMVRVWMKDGTWFAVHPDEWPTIRHAYVSGAAIYEGRDTYDSPVVIRLGNVAAIDYRAPEVIAQVRADERADKANEVIE